MPVTLLPRCITSMISCWLRIDLTDPFDRREPVKRGLSSSARAAEVVIGVEAQPATKAAAIVARSKLFRFIPETPFTPPQRHAANIREHKSLD